MSMRHPHNFRVNAIRVKIHSRFDYQAYKYLYVETPGVVFFITK